ncbi:hypothetical protein CSB45_14885, partial [candidate division KSB3 bacterium]
MHQILSEWNFNEAHMRKRHGRIYCFCRLTKIIRFFTTKRLVKDIMDFHKKFCKDGLSRKEQGMSTQAGDSQQDKDAAALAR